MKTSLKNLYDDAYFSDGNALEPVKLKSMSFELESKNLKEIQAKLACRD